MLGQVRFESLCQFPPREQDAPAATLTLQADIRAKTRDNPFIGATRMLFPQAQMIVQAQVR